MSLLSRLVTPPSPSASAVQRLDQSDGWLTRIVSRPTAAGINVTEHSALKVTAVYSAIGIIAENVAQLPIDVYREEGDRKIPQPDHPASRLLNEAPNRYMVAFTFRSTLQSHVLGWGNGYAEVQRDNGGRPIGLWPLLPDRTGPEAVNGEIRFRSNVDGQPVALDYDQVLHIPALGFDGLVGYSPIRLASDAIGLFQAAEKWGGKFFKNDAKSGGFIEYPGRLSEEGRKNLSEFANDQGGLDNAHRVKILEEGAKFHSITIPPEDAQFLATREFQITEIARLYRVALHMLQSHQKDTAWGTGIAQMQMGFLVYTLATWLVRWEQELRRKLFTQRERDQGFYIKHNVGGLLRGDAKTRAEVYQLALQNRWLTVDEVRELEDRDPLGQREEVDVANLETAVPR